MLCQFTFKNFKSYRDETVLDMQAAKIEEFSDTIIPAPCDRFASLVPVSAIYGPNAGGKTNVINALAYLISRIITPIKASTDTAHPFTMFLTKYAPFLFDEASKDAPTDFNIIFRTGFAEYQYNLSIMQNIVISESLSCIKIPCKRRRPTILFQRNGAQITPGPALKKANSQQVSASIPYISFLSINYNFPEIKDAIGWFQDCCVINYSVPSRDHRFSSILDDPHVKPAILEILSDMDIPISDYEIREDAADDSEKKNVQIITTHIVGNTSYQLDLRDESEGTVKILSALPAVVTTLATGGLLLVDELDAKLHPQLLRAIVKLYKTPELNNEHAQLIFSCHDLSIMKNDLLRRDEIWFAARNEESISELWSLYDLRDEKGERIKNTAAYDKQYLAGRYGADPYLKQMLDWRVPDGGETETT